MKVGSVTASLHQLNWQLVLIFHVDGIMKNEN